MNPSFLLYLKISTYCSYWLCCIFWHLIDTTYKYPTNKLFKPHWIANKTLTKCKMSNAKITYLIFSFDHFILDAYAFDPVVDWVISPVSCFDKDCSGICHATAEQRRQDMSDCVSQISTYCTLDILDYCPMNNLKQKSPTGCHILKDAKFALTPFPLLRINEWSNTTSPTIDVWGPSREPVRVWHSSLRTDSHQWGH